jgi:hypothetical protein
MVVTCCFGVFHFVRALTSLCFNSVPHHWIPLQLSSCSCHAAASSELTTCFSLYCFITHWPCTPLLSGDLLNSLTPHTFILVSSFPNILAGYCPRSPQHPEPSRRGEAPVFLKQQHIQKLADDLPPLCTWSVWQYMSCLNCRINVRDSCRPMMDYVNEAESV